MSNTNKPLTAEEVAKNFANRVKWEREQTASLLEELALSNERVKVHMKEVMDKDALIKGLEKECDRWKYAYEDMTRNMEATHIASCETEKELESVKRKLNAIREQRAKDLDYVLTARLQRDEAVKYLYALPSAWRNHKINAFLAGIFAEGTKPPSPWISVEEVPPVVGKDYNFIVDIPHSERHGQVLGGKYLGCKWGYHEFSTPGISYAAKLYCHIPSPPESFNPEIHAGIINLANRMFGDESLTDKK